MRSKPALSPLSSGREVLVVDDEARIRNMLSQALQQAGYQGTLVGSAEAAQRVLDEKAFDIVILDLNLPGISGLDFLEKIRRQQHDVQAIILTGFGDLEAARRAIHLDAVEFLSKPCTLGQLEVALERANKRRKGQIIDAAVASGAPAQAFEESEKPRTFVLVTPQQTGADPASLEDMEQRHILSVLQKHNGVRTAAAAELGISLRKLYYRLGEYQKKGLLP